MLRIKVIITCRLFDRQLLTDISKGKLLLSRVCKDYLDENIWFILWMQIRNEKTFTHRVQTGRPHSGKMWRSLSKIFQKRDVKTTTKKSIYSLKASNIAFKTNAVVDPGFPRGGGTNPKGGGRGDLVILFSQIFLRIEWKWRNWAGGWDARPKYVCVDPLLFQTLRKEDRK